MSLATYQKKRDFNRSPEPRSTKAPSKNHKLKFVIQRHNASRLHYDFRLEMEGVFKSWAVPKGPSMIPGVKRMAIMVEDHPLEYGKFHGVIPEGNYGAGTVEIWDKGTYKPVPDKGDHENNLLEMLRKGDVKFSLNGTYLKGRFALFRIGDPEKENEWLLVKKADEFAENTFDIESLNPLKSVNIYKTNKKITGKGPDPFPDPLPVPMLLKNTLTVPEKPDWFYEMKLDGYRMLCSVKGGKVELVSRNGNTFSNQFKFLTEDLGRIEEEIIIDGEVVVEDSKGHSRFQLLQDFNDTHQGNLKYYIFDILYLSGHNLMRVPLRSRKELLDAFYGKYNFNNVIMLEHQEGNGMKLFKDLAAKGFEGVVAKDPESFYFPGKRTGSWLKVKATRTQEAIICGYTCPQGSRKYFGSIILGQYSSKGLNYIGNCGTGFSDRVLKDLYVKFRNLETDVCPFSDPFLKLPGAKGKPVWLKPRLTASIKFLELTTNGIMRNPVFLGISDNEQPDKIVRVPKGPGSDTTKTRRDNTVELAGIKVRLTNLQKMYWRVEGYSKGDLISYYQSISKIILPYLRDRPQSLNRYPSGIEGKSFYQKDIDPGLAPDWIKTARMESGSHSEGVNYMICNNAATLLYMVNLGCIEINPWHSRYKKPQNPSYLILDLDPGRIPFREVVNTALVIKEICNETGIPCYPKTSGVTGMHVYIPLGEKYDYDQARTFAEILAVITHNRLPLVTSLERAVAKRTDKVYIDYLQNRKGQTVAAAYSVRPGPLPTVSTPLSWKEVNFRLSPEMFTIKNIQQRLEKTGELWQPVLGKGISLLKALRAIEKVNYS